MCYIFTLDSSQFFDPQKVYLPRSEGEIVDLVKVTLKEGRRLRVLGSGHTRNPLALSDTLLSLHDYRGIVHLDKQAQQVELQVDVEFIVYSL